MISQRWAQHSADQHRSIPVQSSGCPGAPGCRLLPLATQTALQKDNNTKAINQHGINGSAPVGVGAIRGRFGRPVHCG